MEKEEMTYNPDAFVAGWVGGASSVIAAHPLDTIKVRLQTSTKDKGTFDCALRTVRREGVRGFYKGMSFPLVSASAYNSLIFGCYEHFQLWICRFRYGDETHAARFTDQCLAAMATGAVSVSLGSPIDLIKIRLQVQRESTKSRNSIKFPSGLPLNADTKRTLYSTSTIDSLPSQTRQYKGPIDCASDIYKRHGLRGLYRGAPTMIVRDIPGYTFYLVPYGIMRNYFAKDGDDVGIAGLLASALAGGLSGVLSWGIVHPIDTVKSRIQADIGVSKPKYRGGIHCVQCMYREHGVSVFFRGITMNALRGFPQSAALFCGVELTMQMFGKARNASK